MKIVKWLKLASLGALVVGTVTVATGASVEHRARARVRAEGRIPGKLVTVDGGRRIQLDCRGSGSPTVVLESGLDTYGSLAWAAVHDSLARTMRVCAYSRAGIMWSDPAGVQFDSRNAARDLHAALTAGGEVAPWVMVGHSIGAAYVMTFASLFDAEVDGLVFVDGSHPDQFARLRKATGKAMEPSATVFRIGAALAWTGLVRALPGTPTPAAWPAELGESTPLLPTSLAAIAGETMAVPRTLARASLMQSLGDLPLLVFTATRGPEPAALEAMGLTADHGERLQVAFRELHADQASWSRVSRHILVPNASHYIQFDRPDVVIDEMRRFVDAIRSSPLDQSSTANRP